MAAIQPSNISQSFVDSSSNHPFRAPSIDEAGGSNPPHSPPSSRRGSSGSLGSFVEVDPLLQTVDNEYLEVSSDTPGARAVSGGGHVEDTEHAISAEARSLIQGSLLWVKSKIRKGDAALPKEKTLSSESTFEDMETFIKGIGSEDLSYLKTIWYRAPKHGKETYNLVKNAGSSLAGTATAYAIGTAIGLPTGFVFGAQLGNIFSGYYENSVSIFEKGERPLGQEFMQKWVYLKVVLKDRFDKLEGEPKKSALELQNWIDYCAKDYVKPTRKEELTSTNLDFACMFVMRYAFILAGTSLKSQAAYKPLDSSLDPNIPYHKRLIHFDPIKQAEILDIEKSIVNNCDPNQAPGLPVTKFVGGPGGVGKTSLIKMQAEYLKVPFKKLSLTKISIEKLRGHEGYSPMDRNTSSLDEKVGLLAIELVRMGYGIVFIDEADALNNPEMAAFWKTILQDKPELYVRSLGFTIDLSRFTFYFAANVFLEDPALIQRLSNLPFDGLTHIEKMNAANDQLTESLAIIEKRSGSDVKEKVHRVANSWIAFMANLDILRNSGGRVIKSAMESFCSRLEDKFKADDNAALSDTEIEKMISDIYQKYPAEETLDQRVEATERESALKYLNNLQNKIQDHANNRSTIEILIKDVKQAKVSLNDEAMLLILSALSGENKKLKITDVDEQASALYLVGALSTVSGRKASEPKNTMLALFQCLDDLLLALNNKSLVDSNCRLKLLTIMRNILAVLPEEGKDFRSDRVRNQVHNGLKAWKASKENSDISDSVKNQLALILE